MSAVAKDTYENIEVVHQRADDGAEELRRRRHHRSNSSTAPSTACSTPLDPHSAYLPPDLYKELQVDTRGSFGGLGIEITMRNGVLTVVSPIEDTPAYRAGVKSGRPDHQDRRRVHQGHDAGRGRQEDARPEGDEDPPDPAARGRRRSWIDLTLTREVIKIQSVKSRMLEKGYGYLRITQFQERTDDDLQKALANAREGERRAAGRAGPRPAQQSRAGC